MTKEEIEQKIEELRTASRKIKGAQQQLAYLSDLKKYEKILREKFGVADEASSLTAGAFAIDGQAKRLSFTPRGSNSPARSRALLTDPYSEIFLSNHKAGSMAGINAQDAAVVCSLAIQYGVPLDVIR